MVAVERPALVLRFLAALVRHSASPAQHVARHPVARPESPPMREDTKPQARAGAQGADMKPTIALLLALVLTACGGGKVSGPDESVDPPHCVPEVVACQ